MHNNYPLNLLNLDTIPKTTWTETWLLLNFRLLLRFLRCRASIWKVICINLYKNACYRICSMITYSLAYWLISQIILVEDKGHGSKIHILKNLNKRQWKWFAYGAWLWLMISLNHWLAQKSLSYLNPWWHHRNLWKFEKPKVDQMLKLYRPKMYTHIIN